MLRYIIKNLSGLSSKTEASPHRYRTRLFRSLSPAIRYDETKKEPQEVDYQNLSQRSRSCTRSNNINKQPVQVGWLSKLEDSRHCNVSQTRKYHRKQKKINRTTFEKKYGEELDENRKSEYYEESRFDTKFYTGEKYELEAARPRQQDQNTPLNILEKMQKLDKENGEPTTQYLQPRNIKPFGAKQIYTPITLKTKRLHSVALPKVVKDKDSTIKSGKKSKANEDIGQRNYSTATTFKHRHDNPVPLIYNLPVGGYNKNRLLPKPKKFNIKNQIISTSLEEKEANEQIRRKLKSVQANIVSDDLFHESLKKLQNFKSEKEASPKKFSARSNIAVDKRMKSAFTANVNPLRPKVIKKINSATYHAKSSYDRQLSVDDLLDKPLLNFGSLNLKTLKVKEKPKSIVSFFIDKPGKKSKFISIENGLRKNSKQFQPKVVVSKKVPIKSHITLKAGLNSDKTKIKKQHREDKEIDTEISLKRKKQNTAAVPKFSGDLPIFGNVKAIEPIEESSILYQPDLNTSKLLAKLKLNAKTKQETSISKGRIEKNRKTKLVKTSSKIPEGIMKAGNLKFTGDEYFKVNPKISLQSKLKEPIVTEEGGLNLVTKNEEKINQILPAKEKNKQTKNIKHLAADKQKEVSKEEVIEPINLKIQDSKTNLEKSSKILHSRDDSVQPALPLGSNKNKANDLAYYRKDTLVRSTNVQNKSSKSAPVSNNEILRNKEDTIIIQSKSKSKDVEEKAPNIVHEKDSAQLSKKSKTLSQDAQSKAIRSKLSKTTDSCKEVVNNKKENKLAESQDPKEMKFFPSKSNMPPNMQPKISKFSFTPEHRKYETKLVNKVTKPELQKKILTKSGCRAFLETHSKNDIVNHLHPNAGKSNKKVVRSSLIEDNKKINSLRLGETQGAKKKPSKPVDKKIVENSSKTEIILIRNNPQANFSKKSKTDINLTLENGDQKGVSDVKQVEALKNLMALKSFSDTPQNDVSNKKQHNQTYLEIAPKRNNQEQFTKTITPNIQQLSDAAKKLLTHAPPESDPKYILHPKIDTLESLSKINAVVSKNAHQLSEAAKKIMSYKSDGQSFFDSLPKGSWQESSQRNEVPDTKGTQQLKESAKKIMSYKSDGNSFLESVPKGSVQESPPKLDVQDTQTTKPLTESAKKIMSYKTDKQPFLGLVPKGGGHESPPKVEVLDSQQSAECASKNMSHKLDQNFLDLFPKRDKQEPPPIADVQQQFLDSTKKDVSLKFDSPKKHAKEALSNPKSQEIRIVNQLTEAAKRIISYNTEYQSFLELPPINGGLQKNSEIEKSKINENHFLVEAPLGGDVQNTQNIKDSNRINASNVLTEATKKIIGYISEYQALFTKPTKTEVNSDESSKQIDEFINQATFQSCMGNDKHAINDQVTMNEDIIDPISSKDDSVTADLEDKIGYMLNDILQTSPIISPSISSDQLNSILVSSKMFEETKQEDFIKPKPDINVESCTQNKVPVLVAKICEDDEKYKTDKRSYYASFVKQKAANTFLQSRKPLIIGIAHSSTKVSPEERKVQNKSDKVSSYYDLDNLYLKQNCMTRKYPQNVKVCFSDIQKAGHSKTFTKNMSTSTSRLLSKPERTSIKGNGRYITNIGKLGSMHESMVLLSKLSTESLAMRGYGSYSKTNVGNKCRKYSACEPHIRNVSARIDIGRKYTKAPAHYSLSNITENTKCSSNYVTECKNKYSSYRKISRKYSSFQEAAKSTSYLDNVKYGEDKVPPNKKRLDKTMLKLPIMVKIDKEDLERKQHMKISQTMIGNKCRPEKPRPDKPRPDKDAEEIIQTKQKLGAVKSTKGHAKTNRENQKIYASYKSECALRLQVDGFRKNNSRVPSHRSEWEEDQSDLYKINTLFVRPPASIIKRNQPSLNSGMFSNISNNVLTPRQLRNKLKRSVKISERKNGIYQQKRILGSTKNFSKIRRLQKNSMNKRAHLLCNLMEEKHCPNLKTNCPYSIFNEYLTDAPLDRQTNHCRPTALKQIKIDKDRTEGLTDTSQFENLAIPCNYLPIQHRYIPDLTKTLGDIKKICTYLPKQLFSVFVVQQRSLFNLAYNQNYTQEDDDITKLPCTNSERSYHFLCKKAEKNPIPQSELKSNFTNNFSEFEEDSSPFTKIRSLQWRINNFHKWHRLNKLTHCQSDHIKRYYSSMNTNIDVSQSFSTLPHPVYGRSNSYILTAYEKLLESKRISLFNEILTPINAFEQQKQLASTNAICRRGDKQHSKYLSKCRRRSAKYAASDECLCMDREGKQLQPQYPILPELERSGTNETLFPEPVNSNVKAEYMRHKFGIPKTGVTLDCDSFQEAFSSGQMKSKRASKQKFECDESVKQIMPECSEEAYCETAKKEDTCDIPKKERFLAKKCKSKCPKSKKAPRRSKSLEKCEKLPPKTTKDSCKVKRTPSIWEKIINYFKARPNCPAPDEWKKKAAREKAERYAKAAGLCLCEPKDLNCVVSPKPLVCSTKDKKKPEALPRVITCPPPIKKPATSQGYSNRRSFSMCAMTLSNSRDKYIFASPYFNDTKRIFLSTRFENPNFNQNNLETHTNNIQKKHFSTSAKLKKSRNDSKEANPFDTLSTSSNQENVGDTFKELSQNLIDAENEDRELDDDDANKSEDDDKSVKSVKGASKFPEKRIHNIIPKRCYSEKGRNRNIDDINKTLEEKEKQKLAEKIIRSILDASINHHNHDVDNLDGHGVGEYNEQKHGYEQDDDYWNPTYKFFSRKTSLTDIIFREPIDEYMKYCQARSFANFIEGFHKMEVLSDVNYEDIEKMKTNKLVNELNKLIVDKNQSKK